MGRREPGPLRRLVTPALLVVFLLALGASGIRIYSCRPQDLSLTRAAQRQLEGEWWVRTRDGAILLLLGNEGRGWCASGGGEAASVYRATLGAVSLGGSLRLHLSGWPDGRTASFLLLLDWECARGHRIEVLKLATMEPSDRWAGWRLPLELRRRGSDEDVEVARLRREIEMAKKK